MGEYAEMMLDGTCCQYCGEYIGSNNGYPTSCACCSDDVEEDLPRYFKKRQKSNKRNKKCPLCESWFCDDKAINNHLMCKHKAIKCQYCNEVSQDWFELKVKVKNYARSKFIFCADCRKNIKYILKNLHYKVVTSEFDETGEDL
jgi:hypothetical protein